MWYFYVMKTKHLFWAVPLAIIVILIFSLFSFNNSAVRKLETVKTSLSNVESSYQRRADVITGLVNTVKGAADFEKEVLTDVVEARAKAGQTNINLNDLNANSINQFAEAQQALSGALSRLLVTVERYPELKATQNFLEFQSQLEGTENRINVERNRYNQAVNTYNTHIKVFPNALYAGWLGFSEEFQRFQSSEGSQDAPEISFD
jgi:LemA protein